MSASFNDFYGITVNVHYFTRYLFLLCLQFHERSRISCKSSRGIKYVYSKAVVGFHFLLKQNNGQTNGQEDGPDPPSMDSPESSLVKEAPVIAIPVRREYQQFPLLQGNPSPGDFIAFKV